MRLLHTSDWHLGRRLHGQDLLEHQGAFLGWLLDRAVQDRVDAVLVSGDVYDRAQPPPEAVRLLDTTVAAFAEAGVPLVLSSGNHDSAIRLQYAGAVMERAGVHLRTALDQVARPVLVEDEAGPVGIYAVPYLVPDGVVESLGVPRSHGAVLAAAAARIRQDALERGLHRTVVMAHAFVTGGSACDSEREIRVGGVGDAPAEVLDGFSYVALGHLHGPQELRMPGSTTRMAYSGSPLAFSFSERDHCKSVTLVELDGRGDVALTRIPVPVPRPLRQVRGRLSELLALATQDDTGLAQSWVKVVLTDPGRVSAPMEQLRQHWPHTLVLEFDPEGAGVGSLAMPRLSESSDPLEICCDFVASVSGGPPSQAQRQLLAEAVAAGRRAEAVA